MAIGFLFLSLLGAFVFLKAGDIPVMIVFVGLSVIYATEIPTNLMELSASRHYPWRRVEEGRWTGT
jgi:hypothetical protein